ncbi:hypothetical protein PT7_1599 [Pusillimonas sp. T7-7]|uniref:acetolactate synthase large subunit n=1 Tax=Pusillimonas sp. (strain T7-7) TaxID=1007105 RepID=UPI0002085185|nr:acetolactate synthase large subunit [Pusillimonas sp. T7-7]AEC20139.1 hypothetical protein PT7_1599 [Pusillimonas sp. T7-7]
MSVANVQQQTGAQWLLRSAARADIRMCFANPGTTELPFVTALDSVPEVRPVLSLFEGVCSGAADGYFRISRKPAMVLTHLGPGFANSIANFHNARRARSAIFNVIGDHMTWHLAADAPLASDINSLASPVSAGVWRANSAEALQRGTLAALGQVRGKKAGIATLILPMDMQSVPISAPLADVVVNSSKDMHNQQAVEELAARIRKNERVLLLLGDDALAEKALLQASRLVGLPQLELIGETFPATSEHGGGLPAIRRFPYLAEQAHPYLLEFDCVALVGAKPPVAFFGSEGYPSFLGDPARMITVSEPGSGGLDALERLADALKRPAPFLATPDRISDAGLAEDLTPATASQVIAAHLPENAVVSAEGGTLGFPFNQLAYGAARHTTMVLTGGAIGQGLPCAFGASMAVPDRKVVALQSDGSALFTPQALWSMARESANVVVLIASNQRYQVLQNEMKRTGNLPQAPAVQNLLSISGPNVDWQALSASFGVPSKRVASVSDLRRTFQAAIAEPGPRLIEVMLP